MDPITVAIMSALSAGLTDLMVKDAYEALKARIRKKFGDESKVVKAVSEVEQEPDFKPNQVTLAGRIEQEKASGDTELLRLAQDLQKALEKTAAGQAALAKYELTIHNSQVGIVGDNARVDGGLHFNKE